MSRLNASLSAMRAISVITVRHILKPALLMTAIVFVALYCLMLFLVLSFSAWWWLLLLILLPLTAVTVAIGLIATKLLNVLLPKQLTPEGRARVEQFTEKLLSVLERSQLSYPVIVFLIAKDIVRRRESGFLRDIIGDSQSLTKEYGEITRLFER